MVADLFHYGHANFLKQARQCGDHLIVGIHSDQVVGGYKRLPIMSMDERIKTVSSCRYVDEVVPEAPLVIEEEWINTHNIDIVVHGDDFSEESWDLLAQFNIDVSSIEKINEL